MSDTNSLIYEPRLVASLQTVESVAKDRITSKLKPKPVTLPPRNKLKRHVTAYQHDECGDEDEEEDNLSGDE